MQTASSPSPQFAAKKAKILQQLAVPEGEYTDLSPKGSVDVGIRTLIDDVNTHLGLVTTSSCAGRVSVFLEGKRTADAADAGETAAPAQLAGVGGKGGGGKWLFVSHDPIALGGASGSAAGGGFADGTRPDGGWAGFFGLGVGIGRSSPDSNPVAPERGRLVHFKFEPMILHVLAASLEDAQFVLRCGLQAGFRESGAVNVSGAAGEPVMPMVAVRSMGLGFESLVGAELAGQKTCTVSDGYLHTLVELANERFDENAKRIERFRQALKEGSREQARKTRSGDDWEDADARRERKRAEGLARSAQLREYQNAQSQ